MLNKFTFTGRVARIQDGYYIVIIGETIYRYNMNWYRPLAELE